MAVNCRKLKLTGLFCLGLIAFQFSIRDVSACDSPIHEYALANWEVSQYLLLVVGNDPASVAEKVVTIRERFAVTGAGGNLVVEAWDREAPELEKFTGEIERLAATYDKEHYVLFSPTDRVVLASDDFSEGGLDRIWRSSVRTELQDVLANGLLPSLVFVTSSNQDETEKALSVVREALYECERQEHPCGLVVVRRDDPAETCFVRQLLLAEPDLEGLDEPMVFPVVGKGYVFLPYVGRGITQKNIDQAINFINGPCTCSIKAENPGFDLLMNCDWESMLAKLKFAPIAPPSFIAGFGGHGETAPAAIAVSDPAGAGAATGVAFSGTLFLVTLAALTLVFVVAALLTFKFFAKDAG